MPEVFNWQLNRKMAYRFEDVRPKKQVAAVFDINKCIGCQTCPQACKILWTAGKGQESMFWNNVETKPWGSYPLAYDVKTSQLVGGGKWEKKDKGYVYQGKTIFEDLPPDEHVLGYIPPDIEWAYPNRGEDEVSEALDGTKYHYGGNPARTRPLLPPVG